MTRDAPHTHSQMWDKSEDEGVCRVDLHHYVDDGMGGVVCTRCGDCGDDPAWFREAKEQRRLTGEGKE